MTLSIDDLHQIFDRAWHDQAIDNSENTGADLTRAGIIAVVTALRDEINDRSSRCGWCAAEGALDHVNETINEILAPRGDEAAGVPTGNSGTELGRTSGPAPAAALRQAASQEDKG